MLAPVLLFFLVGIRSVSAIPGWPHRFIEQKHCLLRPLAPPSPPSPTFFRAKFVVPPTDHPVRRLKKSRVLPPELTAQGSSHPGAFALRNF
jgi:hypothetical protein